MSDKKPKEMENEKKEKVLTKYDLKMQRRAEEKAKEKRSKAISRVVATVLVLAVLAMIAYFPIKSYMASQEIYVTVNGEDVNRIEFDFNYNVAADNYIAQYGSYLSYFGLDVSSDFGSQMYSDTLSWKDYFEQLAVEDLKKTKALYKEAKAAGFVYDCTADLEEFKENTKKGAKDVGLSTGAYVKQLYGPYATLSNISGYYETAVYTNEYYKHVSEEKAATEEEIAAYYNENKSDYDSVDYYMETIYAEMPTEPTDLADPDAETAEDGVYTPSDAEKEKAMADAKEKAEEALKNVVKDANLYVNEKKADADYYIADWLFEDGRKKGDTTVIENPYGNMYYAVSFDKRYRDESLTANLRVIMTSETPGEDILNEWKAGAATEESFIELCDRYTEVGAALGDGGLLENVTKSMLSADMAEWVFAEGRAAGDATAITTAEGYSYVMYYIGQGDPEWKAGIADTLLGEALAEYLQEITANISVEDKNGKLYYLKVQALEEAAAAVIGSNSGENQSDGADQ